MLFKKLSELATIDISNVDKKTKTGEQEVKLCNFVDVYHKWALKDSMVDGLMSATANENQISRFKLHSGQVAITKDSETKDDIGMAMLVDINMPDVVLGYHCALITPDGNELSASYLNVVLHSSYASKYFEMNASGSGQRYTLTNDIIGNFPVPIISLKEQKSISDVFDQINNKILTNNAIISELEFMAKDIYDYWFVQFDFPDENGKPYKSSGGKMVWNEELKREIPEGWKVSLIENWCKIFTGKKDVNQSLDSGEYKFFSCAPSFRYSNEKIYSGKAILISGNGSYTGRTILVNDAFDLYQRTYACVMKDQLPDIVEYIYYTMKRFFVPKVIGGTHGSAIPYIVYNDIAKEKLVYEESVVKKFLEVIVQVQELISVLSKEINELSSLRDFLLPLLMNGQVKIEEPKANE